jgi:sulfide dehydrogenase cytochrome subunit
VPRRLIAALLLPGLAQAAPPPQGAAACSGCHAVPARAGAAIPSLAGRPAEEIAEQLLAFRQGEGSPTVMDRIARGFSEAELRAIAEWVARP